MKTRTLAVALGAALLLSSAQIASAGYAVCIRIAVGVIASGVYAIQSCNPVWRCWCVPVDEENPMLGCSTNFPSQVLYRVGRENGWFAARNLTYKTQAKAIAAGCTTNNISPNEVSPEEYLDVEEAPSADGPWKRFQTFVQSPDDIDIMLTNAAPACFYRVWSTNAPPEVELIRMSAPGTNSSSGAIFRAQFEAANAP